MYNQNHDFIISLNCRFMCQMWKRLVEWMFRVFLLSMNIWSTEKRTFIPFSIQVPYPVHKVVENPKPVELEQVHPVNVERPLKYTETVNIPVDEHGRASSNLDANVTGATQNAVNPEPDTNGYQDLSAGYESHKIQKKAWIDHIYLHCSQQLPRKCNMIKFYL